MSNEDILPPTEPASGSRALALALRDLHRDAEILQPIRPVRNDASFVAQLIATADDLPQTRHRRRAEPRDALAAYTSPHDFAPTCMSIRRSA